MFAQAYIFHYPQVPGSQEVLVLKKALLFFLFLSYLHVQTSEKTHFSLSEFNFEQFRS